jgi:hypothetical protein
MLAVLDAAAGRRGGATVLAELAVDPGTPPSLRPLAALAAGYAWRWTGRHRQALGAFERAAQVASGTGLVDDAQYAAALTRLRLGERETALAELETLADAPRRGGRGARSRSLVRLEAGAVLGAGARTYAGSVLEPEARLAGLLDLDGPTLARVALRQLGHGPEIARGPTMIGAATSGATAESLHPAPRDGEAGAGAERGPSRGPRATSRAGGRGLLVVVAIGAAVLLWRRPSRALRRHAAERR